VMVSVDGSRDTPEVMRNYVEKFDPTFIGLTGDEEVIRAFSTDYHLFFNRSAGTPTAAGYLVDHTAYSYLIDQQGKLRTIYPFQAPINLVVEDMRELIGSARQ
jgi:protein SCO1/2